MELNAKQVDFNKAVADAVGRQVEVTEKGTNTVHVFGIKGLDDKMGTMKDGTKVAYTVLERDDSGTLVVTSIHPNIIAKLLKNGSEAGMVLRSVEQEADASDAGEEVVTEVLADKPAEVADELVDPDVDTATTETAAVETPAEDVAPVTAATEEAAPAAAPSKKQRCVAIFKELNGAGKPRKDVIAEFTSKVGLSAAGANTYYQNCKSGLWS